MSQDCAFSNPALVNPVLARLACPFPTLIPLGISRYFICRDKVLDDLAVRSFFVAARRCV